MAGTPEEALQVLEVAYTFFQQQQPSGFLEYEESPNMGKLMEMLRINSPSHSQRLNFSVFHLWTICLSIYALMRHNTRKYTPWTSMQILLKHSIVTAEPEITYGLEKTG